MPIDSSIYFQQQTPDILGSVQKGLSMRDMLTQQKMQQDALAKQKSIDQAYQAGIVQNPDGTVSFDGKKTMSAMAGIPGAGKEVAALGDQNRAREVADAEAKRKKHSDDLEEIGRRLRSIRPETYGAVITKMKQDGYDVSDFPAQYDQNTQKIVNDHILQGLSLKDQMDQQNKDRDYSLKKQDQDLQQKKFNEGKTQENFKDLMSHAESSRQLPDVKQAYTDRYNAQKILDLVKSKKDPNQLDPQMVNLVIGETAKIAQGGAPTEETMSNLSPKDAQVLLARAKQYWSNHPEAGEQGAFIKVYNEYAQALQDNANKVINANLGKLGEMYRDKIKPGDYENYQKHIVNGNPFAESNTDAPPGSGTQIPVFHESEIKWKTK